MQNLCFAFPVFYTHYSETYYFTTLQSPRISGIFSIESFSERRRITRQGFPAAKLFGGIDFVIRQTHEAFDIEIPEINAVYTHMLGHDCHSIVAGADHADGMIAQLNGYIASGYTLILTSHYTPEDLKDAKTKIAYLENLKKIASGCKTAEEFRTSVKEQYPDYSGENYLDMTAGFFFA